MAEVIKMPKMSDTMEEGVIASWLKKVGDEVVAGDILAEVETDKATMELEAYQDGILLHIGIEENQSVPVDGVIAVIGEKGEDFKSLLEKGTAVDTPKMPEVTSSEAPVALQKSDATQVNATIIRMPKMSDTMEEGIIASWLKKVGDEVTAGDILAEVETDKATMELEAYEDGTLLYIAAEASNSIAVDDVIAVIGEKGADYQRLIDQPSKQEITMAPTTSTAASTTINVIATNTQKTHDANEGGRIKASPLAKKIAEDKGIDLQQLRGTGESGRIIKKDVENFTPQTNDVGVDAETIGTESSEKINLSQMRKSIAKRLSQSKFNAPHFYLTMEIKMDKVMEVRKSLNEISDVKISFNDIVIKCVAVALRKNPDINVSWEGDYLMKHHHIHVGVAVAIPDGLIVPVVKFADNKSLSRISTEIKSLGQKARDKKLQPQEFSGNTFTVSNLGMFGIEDFTAIINPPDACILAVGGIKEAVIVEKGEMRAGNVMKVTLSCDHRAVDGAVGATFLSTLKTLMEDPVKMLL